MQWFDSLYRCRVSMSEKIFILLTQDDKRLSLMPSVGLSGSSMCMLNHSLKWTGNQSIWKAYISIL